MKKLISTLVIAAMFSVACFAQADTANIRDSAGWNSVTSTPVWTTAGYDIVLSQTNVTALQLGTSNTVPNLAGILGKTRVLGVNNTEAAFASFLAANPVSLPYTLWARTAAQPVGGTNYVVSDWTSIVVTWTGLPLPPTNLRIIHAP